MIHGLNTNLLEKRYKFFMRTLVTCITAIIKQNPEAAALLVEVGTIGDSVNKLIEFVKEQAAA